MSDDLTRWSTLRLNGEILANDMDIANIEAVLWSRKLFKQTLECKLEFRQSQSEHDRQVAGSIPGPRRKKK